MTSANRQQLAAFGSLKINPIYMGKVQCAVDGRLMFLITVYFLSGPFHWLMVVSIGIFYTSCQCVTSIYAEHPNANHIAFAYRIKTGQGFVSRFHDAGEPAGTAGKPIFQHIEGKQLINVLIAVIRYFGGVKLGAGGLTRAYGNSAKSVIEAAEIHLYVEQAKIRLTLDYSRMQPLEYQLKKLDGRIVEQDFAEQVKLLIELPAENVDTLLQSFPRHA